MNLNSYNYYSQNGILMKYNFGLKSQILRTTNARQIVLIATLAAVLVMATATLPSFNMMVQYASADVMRPDSPDFNGDGKADLAIGVPSESIGTSGDDEGAANVLYGTTGGLSSANDQFWSQASSGVLETAEPRDHFGTSIATGDFDGDGFSDLAAGVPDENVGSAGGGGAVNVIYGSSSRLTSSGNQVWSQNSAGVLDSVECHDEPEEGEPVCDSFGSSVAAGDFNGDGRDDLAVGTPDEDIGSVVDAGAVNVLYGSSSGLTAEGDDFWHQDVSGVESSAEARDRFGSVLAAGDFDRDGFADLAIGVPFEDVGDKQDIGAVSILFGSSSGLTASGDQFWTQDSSGVLDTAEGDDLLGSALATGDFDDDGFADLAIGVPGEDVGSIVGGEGAVNVLYGSSSGLTAEGDDFWHQDVSGVESSAEEGDSFGSSLVAGDFDENGKDDLAIGVPSESVGDKFQIGAVNVIYGTSSGLSSSGDQFWTQDSPGIEGTATSGGEFGAPRFGASLGAGDYNGDGSTDLAVGVPGDFISNQFHGGAVNVIYGSSSDGLTSINDQLWSQDSSGVEDTVEDSDVFGSSLSGEETIPSD
jgi:hypothetical protein